MRLQGTIQVLGAGAVCGLAAFWISGAFHWTYLSALGGMFWAYSRIGREVARGD